MSLTFDENGVQTNTYDEIFQRLVDGYKTIYGTDIDIDQDSPDGQRVGIETTLRFDIESALAWIYSQLDPDLNNGDMQQIIAKLAGIYLLASSRSQWDLEVETDRVLTLPSGYTITDNNNQDWFLETPVDLLLSANNVTFKSKLWGDISGVASGSSFTQATPELGILSISASLDAVKGREEETEEQFRVRRKRSVENPSQSTIGAIYAKLAQLPGVVDLQVYDNSSDTLNVITGSSNPDAINNPEPITIDVHTMWVVIEGGTLDDIGEVIAKQRLGNTKGNVTVSYTDELTKPDATTVFIINEHQIDRQDDVDLYVKLTATQKVSGSAIDTAAIKNSIASYAFIIGQYIQAGELYPLSYIQNFNYVVSDLEVSLDGVTYTDEQIFSGYAGKLKIDVANIDITEVPI